MKPSALESRRDTTRMKPRCFKRERRRFYVLLLVICFLAFSEGKVPSNKAVITTKKSRKSKLNSNTTAVLQVTETEVWDGTKWKGGQHRWTTSDSGDPTVSPDKQEAPNGLEFAGDWKIVTTRDAYGWEYTLAQPFPLRRRVWLRSLQKSTKAVRRRRKLPAWLRAIRDDFNFKGFGWTFYKSLVFSDSVGVAFRLPLTYNFGAWERQPGLPSISSNFCLYYPFCGIAMVSGSMRVEWIHWAISRVVALSYYYVAWLVWNFWRGVIIALSAIVYPFTRQLWNPDLPLAYPSNAKPNYSRTVEERLGCTVSWRYSLHHGYEFRVSYWHWYAPTLTSIFQALSIAKVPDWFARRSAAIGLSSSMPILDPPYCTCSAALSLSGYYFQAVQPTTTSRSGISQTASAKTIDPSANTTTATNVLHLEEKDERKALKKSRSKQLST